MSTSALFERYYFARPDFVDGTVQFHQICRDSIRSKSQILEIGAGPSNPTSTFLATLGPLAGVDVSDEVRQNTALSAAYIYNGGELPFAASSFDACVSNYVLEHIADTAAHFREVGRVLRDGGVYCFRTPNLWHYVTIGSRLMPHWIHLRLANRLRSLPAEAHGPYPTVYRSNTEAALRRHCTASGLDLIELRHLEAEPCYGRSHRALFYPMLAYERIVNSASLFEQLRSNLFGVAQRRQAFRRDPRD